MFTLLIFPQGTCVSLFKQKHTDRHTKLRTTISWVASSSEKSLFLSNNHISRDYKWIFFMKLDVVNKIKRVWSQTQIFAPLKQRQAPGEIIIIHTINTEIVNISTTIFEMHCFFLLCRQISFIFIWKTNPKFLMKFLRFN